MRIKKRPLGWAFSICIQQKASQPLFITRYWMIWIWFQSKNIICLCQKHWIFQNWKKLKFKMEMCELRTVETKIYLNAENQNFHSKNQNSNLQHLPSFAMSSLRLQLSMHKNLLFWLKKKIIGYKGSSKTTFILIETYFSHKGLFRKFDSPNLQTWYETVWWEIDWSYRNMKNACIRNREEAFRQGN